MGLRHLISPCLTKKKTKETTTPTHYAGLNASFCKSRYPNNLMPSESIRSRVLGSVILPVQEKERNPHPLRRLKRQLLQIPIPKQLNTKRVNQIPGFGIRHSPCLGKKKETPTHYAGLNASFCRSRYPNNLIPSESIRSRVFGSVILPD